MRALVLLPFAAALLGSARAAGPVAPTQLALSLQAEPVKLRNGFWTTSAQGVASR